MMRISLAVLSLLVALSGCDPFGGIPDAPPPPNPMATNARVVGAPDSQQPDGGFEWWPLVQQEKPIPPPAPPSFPEPDPQSYCVAGYQEMLVDGQAYCWPVDGYAGRPDGNGCRIGVPLQEWVGNVDRCSTGGS